MMHIPCVTVPCGFLIDDLLEVEAIPVLSLLLAGTIAWLLLLRCVHMRSWVLCSVAVTCGILGVGHSWQAPRCHQSPGKSFDTRLLSMLSPRLAIFWHIGAFEHRSARLDEIISRQFECESRRKNHLDS